MNLYVDSSVLLRIVLGEPRSSGEWKKAKRLVSSELIRVECLRTIDRARVRFGLAAEEVAARRSDVLARLETFELVPLHAAVLERAADPFPVVIGTLDALHLTSARFARHRYADLLFATHDDELATAARAEGFRVVGGDRAPRPRRARPPTRAKR